MVVVEFAKSGRAACRTCSKFIPEGAMKLGTAKNNEGYLNMEWHHEDCFWNKRCKKYFYRGRKKINTVLKVEQFSNMDILNEDQRQRIVDEVLRVNLANATPAALEKAGIEMHAKVANEDATNQDAEAQPEPALTGKKRKKVVVEFAKSGRAACRTCSKFIPEGAMKLGTAESNRNMEWHYEDCFWNKRCKKYFYRGRKKINTVLKVEQFSNMDILNEDQRQRIVDEVLRVNLANATPAALEKAGIEVHAKEAQREPAVKKSV